MMNHKHKGLLKKGKEFNHPVNRVHMDAKAKKWHNTSLNSKQKKYLQLVVAQKKVKKAVKKTGGVKAKVKQIVEDVRNLGRVSKPQKQMPSTKGVATTNVDIDKNGYIFIDLTKTTFKGLRVKFIRIDNNKRLKRTVGLQIEA